MKVLHMTFSNIRRNLCNQSFKQSAFLHDSLIFHPKVGYPGQSVRTYTSIKDYIYRKFFRLIFPSYQRDLIEKMPKLLPKPPKKVVVFQKPGDSNLRITLELCGKMRQLNRPCDETVENSFKRIRANITKYAVKPKHKRAKIENEEFKDDSDVKIALFNADDVQFELTAKNGDAWPEAKILRLNDQDYSIHFNIPSISTLCLTENPVAGTLLYPRILFENAQHSYSRFSWYRSTTKAPTNQLIFTDAGASSNNNSELEWEFLHNDKTHDLTSSDVGHVFKVEVQAGSERHPAATTTDNVSATCGAVLRAQESYIFSSRHLHTKECCENGSFRVVCYNILADCYASTEYAQTELFAHCPQHAIDINYRIQLLLKELKGYHGDIICLQEVDRFVFEDHLVPAFSLHNFGGAYAPKKQVKEGVSIFYNRSKFKVVSIENKIIFEALNNDPCCSGLSQRLSNDVLRSRVTQRASCVLISVLQSVEDPERLLVVANTHLYWHPKASNIRLIQTAVIVNLVEDTLRQLAADRPDAKLSYMVCGDFNSSADTSILQLWLTGKVPANHADWYSGGKTEYHNNEYMDLSHDLSLVNAGGEQAYTNYVPGFFEQLDYILVHKNSLNATRVIPPPLHDDVIRYSCLPSVAGPSDHIAQVVDLAWKDVPE